MASEETSFDVTVPMISRPVMGASTVVDAGLETPPPVSLQVPRERPAAERVERPRGAGRRHAAPAPRSSEVSQPDAEVNPPLVHADALTAPSAEPPAPEEVVAPQPSTPVATMERRFDLTRARVDVGSPVNLDHTGTMAVNVAMGHARGALVECYRRALPSLSGPVDGTANLHLETDDEGRITGARVTGGPVLGGVASCIEASVRGARIPGVDTGAASADVPLEFVPR
jgi:hypothetical protein